MERRASEATTIDEDLAPSVGSIETRRSDLMLLAATVLTLVSMLLWHHALGWTSPILSGTGEVCGTTEYGPPVRNTSIQTLAPAVLSSIVAVSTASITRRPKLAVTVCAMAILAIVVPGLVEDQPNWFSVVYGDCY